MDSSDEDKATSKQSYIDNLIKIMNQPHTTTTLGYFFVGMSILLWSSSVTELFGYDHHEGYGGLIFSAVGLSLTLSTIFVNKLMMIVGLERPIRSSLWLSAIAGSYITITTYPWGIPIFSEIAGFATAIFVFLVSYQIDKKLGL